MGGWGQEMAIIDDLQYCKSSKRWVGKKHDDVILEWSPTNTDLLKGSFVFGLGCLEGFSASLSRYLGIWNWNWNSSVLLKVEL